MKISRRDAIKMAGLAAGTAALSPCAATAAGRGGPPMRFVFFIYSNGFHPDHVCPKGLRDMRKTDKLLDVELGPHKLPEATAPLEKYKDRISVVHAVNGSHCIPAPVSAPITPCSASLVIRDARLRNSECFSFSGGP